MVVEMQFCEKKICIQSFGDAGEHGSGGIDLKENVQKDILLADYD